MENFDLGTYIYTRRKELGLSQKDLATFLNVSIPAISKWESNERVPDLSLLGYLCRILKVDLLSMVNNKFSLDNDYDTTNEFNIKTFSNNFSKLRKINNYSLVTLAEKLEVRYQTISKWEKGESLPNLHLLIKCSILFNVSLQELYYGKSLENIETNTININNKKRKNINIHKNLLMIFFSLISFFAFIIAIFKFTEIINDNSSNSSSIYISSTLNNSDSVSTTIVSSNNSSSNTIDSASNSSSSSSEVIINVEFKDKTVDYDGNTHSIYIEGTLNDDLYVEYVNNEQINAGVYEVKAIIRNSKNKILLEKIALLTIKKAKLNVLLKSKTISYDGNEHSLKIEGDLPTCIEVKYINNVHKSPGTYDVIAELKDSSGNYDVEEKLVATLTIEKDGKYHDVYFCYSNGRVIEMVITHNNVIANIPELTFEDGYQKSWVIEGTDTVIDSSYLVKNDLVLVEKRLPNTYSVQYMNGDVLLFQDEVLYGSTYMIKHYDIESENYYVCWTYNGITYAPGENITFNFLEDIVLQISLNDLSEMFDISISKFPPYHVSLKGFKNPDLVRNTLEELIIPSTVKYENETYRITRIAGDAFVNFPKLNKIVIPEGVKEVALAAFRYCGDNIELHIPSTLEYLGGIYNSTVKKIYIKNLTSWFNMKMDKDVHAVNYDLYLNDNVIEHLVVPEGITTINQYLFRNCSSIKKITLSSTVNTIEQSAFEYMQHLVKVELNPSLTYIRRRAFYSCFSLKYIIMPDNLLTIEETIVNSTVVTNLFFNIDGPKNTWNKDWDKYAVVYYKGQWELVDGEPVILI